MITQGEFQDYSCSIPISSLEASSRGGKHMGKGREEGDFSLLLPSPPLLFPDACSQSIRFQLRNAHFVRPRQKLQQQTRVTGSLNNAISTKKLPTILAHST